MYSSVGDVRKKRGVAKNGGQRRNIEKKKEAPGERQQHRHGGVKKTMWDDDSKD